MRDPAGPLRRLAPASMRDRVFDPAVEDARRERAIRLRRARWSRPAVELIYLWRVVSAVRGCRALAREARHPFTPAATRPFMIRHDIVFALRMLRKAPGFTLAAIVATALGIGANTAIFTVVKHVLLQPLPYTDPERIVDVNEYARGRATAVSPPNFMDWRAGNRTLSGIALYGDQIMTLSGGAEPVRISAGMIDAQLTGVLGLQPLLGRAFTDDDMLPGGRKVVILGHALWQRAFGGDPAIVSRQVTLEGEPYETVGVMPRGFSFPGDSEVWIPLRFTARDLRDAQRGAHFLGAVARLKPGVTVAQATSDLDRIEQDIARQHPDKVGGYSVVAVPLLASMVESVQRPLYILFGAVGFVLLIACVNVSNLLLARATARTGEIAVRAALGAGRRRLIQQLLAESVVLSLAGGLAGVMLASWGVRALMAVAPADLPRAASVQIDESVLLFSMALSVATGMLFGIAPALVASRPDVAVFLRDARRDGAAPGRRRRLRSVLVGAQVAFALILLAGAGLALRSFDRLIRVDPGFTPAGVLTFSVTLPDALYPSTASQTQFFRDFIDRARDLPGVTTAGAVSMLPVTRGGFGGSFTIVGAPPAADEGNAQVRSITPGYMEALSIPLLAGRRFGAEDTETAARVALVSQAAARRFWPGENPVGKMLRIHVNEAVNAPRQIVGIVGDVRTRGMEIDPVPVIYVPHTQYGPESMAIVVRAETDPMSLLPSIKTTLSALAPGVAIGPPRSMEERVAANVAEPRFRALLLSLFAIVSLALAAVGLYGVVAFSVNQRRAELGLRLALGADPGSVLGLVIREGMMPVVLGIAAGIGGAAMLARVMRTLLFNVDAIDPATFAAVSALLALVGLAACYIPARRATRLDPAAILR